MSIIAVKVTAQSHDFYIPTWRISGNLHNMSAFQMPDGPVTCNIIDKTAFDLATGMGSSDKQTLVRMMSNLCEELIQYGYYQRSGDVEDRDDAIPYFLQIVSGVYIGVEVDYSYTPLEDALMMIVGNDAFFYNNHESFNGAYHKYNDSVFLSDSNHVISAVSLYNSGTHGAIQGYSHCGNGHCEWLHYYADNDSNALMNSLVNATWVEPPIPERSNLDMFDLSNRFSPRARSDAFGMYLLNKEDIKALFQDMWTKNVIENFLYDIFGNPMESIMGIKWYYGMLRDMTVAGTHAYLTIGNLNLHTSGQQSSSVECEVPSTEYLTHDFGEVNLRTALSARLRQDYLDYAPYLKFQLYLPYVGYIDINPNDFIDGYIGIKLNLNIATGEGLYVIYAKQNSHHMNPDGTNADPQVMLTVPCNCGVDIPMEIQSMDSLGLQLARLGAGVANFAIDASQSSSTGEVAGKGFKFASGVALDPAETLGIDVPHTMRACGMNTEGGSLGAFNPFLLVTLPIVATPLGFEDIYGNRCAVIDELGDCTGFTQIAGVVPANDDTEECKYKNEIIALLQAGVYMPETTP